MMCCFGYKWNHGGLSMAHFSASRCCSWQEGVRLTGEPERQRGKPGRNDRELWVLNKGKMHYFDTIDLGPKRGTNW